MCVRYCGYAGGQAEGESTGTDAWWGFVDMNVRDASDDGWAC